MIGDVREFAISCRNFKDSDVAMVVPFLAVEVGRLADAYLTLKETLDHNARTGDERG